MTYHDIKHDFIKAIGSSTIILVVSPCVCKCVYTRKVRLRVNFVVHVDFQISFGDAHYLFLKLILVITVTLVGLMTSLGHVASPS